MRSIVFIPAMCLLAFTGYAADAFEKFVSSNPSAEAARAFKSGDKRHIVVPVCQAQGGEIIPGWPTGGPTPPELWTALKNGRRPFQCNDLGEGTKAPRFVRLVSYAEQYNKTLLELEKPLRK